MNRYGMSIDLDKCTGCGACMIACAVENNVPPLPQANDRNGITWIRVFRLENGDDSAFLPVLCQHCGNEPPCVSVCPQQAVQVDPETGIVAQIPQRCLGCRYCMTACPYHARYFNWWDPQWPAGMETTLNPAVATRMRGVVEKCNFCHGRLHAAKAHAAAQGKREIAPADYSPACAEACPSGAIQFVDLNRQPPARDSFRLLEALGTDPKIYYRSRREWVKSQAVKEKARG